jgi:RHS repeat-associated protein
VPGDGTGAFPGGVRQYLEFGDHLGSTGLVDDFDTGDIVERSTYLAYGGPDVDYRNSTPAQFGGPPKYGEFRETYRYTGHDDDSEVGLSYAGARYYMPMLSRWASPDPLTIHGLGSQLNPYAYAANSPYRYRDPFGLQEQQPSDNSEGQQDDPGGDQPSQAGGQPSGQGGNGGQGGGGPYGSGYGPVDYGPRSSGGGYDFGPKVYANYQWSGAASAPSGDASGPHGALDEIQRAYSLRNLSSTFRSINWWRVVDPNGAGQATIQNAKDAADPSLPIDIRVGSGILAVGATIIPEVSEAGLLRAAEGLEATAVRRLATAGDTQFRTAGDALAEALERHGIDPSTVETTSMYGRNPNLIGPQGQPWEMVRGLNADGELIEFEHHANGHFFDDTNEFELPHYHGPDGEHLTY